MKTNARGPGIRYESGREVDAPLRIAAALVIGGFAEPLEVPEAKAAQPVPEVPSREEETAPEVETAAVAPAEEQAVRPAAKARPAMKSAKKKSRR